MANREMDEKGKRGSISSTGSRKQQQPQQSAPGGGGQKRPSTSSQQQPISPRKRSSGTARTGSKTSKRNSAESVGQGQAQQHQKSSSVDFRPRSFSSSLKSAIKSNISQDVGGKKMMSERPNDIKDEEWQDIYLTKMKRESIPKGYKPRKFGYATYLSKRIGLAHESETTTSEDQSFGDEGSRDMSWILGRGEGEIESRDEIKRQRLVSHGLKEEVQDFGKMKESVRWVHILWVFWMTIWIGCRVPFRFNLKFKTDSDKSKRIPFCQYKLKSFTFFFFLVMTIFLSALATISFFSFVAILGLNDDEIVKQLEGEDGGNNSVKTRELKYYRIEILLVEKYWLQYSLFLGNIMTTIFISWSLIFFGRDMAEFLSDWLRILDKSMLPVSKGITFYFYKHVCITTFRILFFIIVYLENLLPGYRGGTFLISITLFRTIVPNFLLKNYAEPIMILVAFIQCYILFCTPCYLLFAQLYARGLANLANAWNLRCGLLLNRITPTHHPEMLKLKESLTFRFLLRCHFSIRFLVRRTSKSFSYIIGFYYLCQILVITSELYKIAWVMFFAQRRHFQEDETEILETLKIPHSDDLQLFGLETLTYLGFSAFGMVSFTKALARVGECMMNGFFYIRRHGLILTTSTKERRFITSLNWSFSEVNPLIICPGHYFKIEKALIIRVFGAALFLFLIMIVVNTPSKVRIPVMNKGKIMVVPSLSEDHKILETIKKHYEGNTTGFN